ncbi:MAG TPA: Gmad2 immunoglobulin-like domain-containing protein [Chloroflexia bacterium]|nr:Gmad2 immunoglobulin-like domain-containing protein [Chloroflexia bacterium]
MRFLPKVLGFLVVMLLVSPIATASAADFASTSFKNLWQYTDYAVQKGVADYSWIWGPNAFTPGLGEWYVDSPGQHRTVQYFDKARMEINDPNASQNSPWYVTNGLLVREMITGDIQVGNSKFIHFTPNRIPVAGDADNAFPTYTDLQRIYNKPAGRHLGQYVTQRLTPNGVDNLYQYANTPATFIIQLEKNYGIPRIFWDFLHREGLVYQNGTFIYAHPIFNWLYVFGYPITDAYWTTIKVGKIQRNVLVQAFERRVLTYTPSNPAQYQVEMGNVGMHYYQWRYVNMFAGNQQLILSSPIEGAQVRSPLLVQGFESGKAFEANLVIRLQTVGGTVLAQQSTLVQRPDVGVPGPWETTLNYTAPPLTTNGRLTVFVLAPRDGSEIVLRSINVVITGAAS